MREKHWSYVPWPGTELTTQERALTRNWTCNLLLYGTTPSQLSCICQGMMNILNIKFMAFQCFFLKTLFIYRERGKEGEREGAKHWCLREVLIGCLSHVPKLGTCPATQACALTGNQICNLLVCRWALNPLSHTSQLPGLYVIII